MYNGEDYFWALSAYYTGAALVLWCLFKYRTLIPWRHFRNLLLVVKGAVILTPVKAYADLTYLAPAWFVAGYGLITGDNDEMTRALIPIIIITVASVSGYVILAILLRKRAMNASKPLTQTQQEPQ